MSSDKHGLGLEQCYEDKRKHMAELCSAAVDKMRTSLGLEDWRIDLQYCPLENAAEVEADCRYRKATVRIDPERAEGDDDILDSLRHELLHCYNAKYLTVWRMMEKHVSGSAMEAISVAFRDADEEVVRRLEDLFDRCLSISPREMAGMDDEQKTGPLSPLVRVASQIAEGYTAISTEVSKDE